MDIKEHDELLIQCRKCPRLVAWREEVAIKKRRAYQSWNYWGKPVPGFGDIDGRVLVVGLAPGAHGSNRTGRMFTGDASGDFLYPALKKAGFANQGESTSLMDQLKLSDLYISAVCRCAPPDNKPTKDEIQNCIGYLEEEIAMMSNLKVVVTLGSIAHSEMIRYYRLHHGITTITPFQHFGISRIESLGQWLISSYHPSQQNTQTGRLTQPMFEMVWQQVNRLLNDPT
jgi:uracil-DNA glycosylase family 4